MGWEDVAVQSHNTFFSPISKDEVSIITSKVKNTVLFRVNFLKENFPEDVAFVKVRIDREKKRFGFFKCKPEEGRKIIHYGKAMKLVYISLPKILGELGFTKGRYDISRLADQTKNPDLYFFVKLESKHKDLVEAEVKEE